MKHLRKYKIFESNTEIDEICREYDIENYTINGDNLVDVYGNVDLYWKKLTSIPLNFNIVNGYFNCGNNYLTSLKGCPVRVGNWFSCHNNKLTSLQYHPTVYGEFYCYNNQINTFENFYYFKEDIDFRYNPIWDIYELFNDMTLVELTRDYGFEYEGEIDLYKLDVFLKETKHEYKGDLREYFEGKKYKWKFIN